jgi:predicted trehalose synthase
MERSAAEIAAQEELQKIAVELERIQTRLQEVHAALPEPLGEDAQKDQDEDEMDVATEVRSVIECVLNDWIRSAIRDLREGAKYRLERKP